MLRRAWTLARDTVEGFIADEAMTRGAAIACYTVFSLAPLLVVAIAIAGLVFGEAAAHGAVAEQLRGLVGREGAEAVQTMILHADAADGGDRGAEAADEVVVVEVELGREASSQSWRTVDGRVAVGGVLVSKWCEAMASGRPNMNACHL